MNLNSLIVAADASSARLFRTGQTDIVQTPIELLEVETIERGKAHGVDDLHAFAQRIARRAGRFAEYHFCNPIIVAATHELSPPLLAALETELPHAYVRSVSGEVASLPAPELLGALREREAFTPVHYSCPV